jgi:hypothetical protein
LSTQNSETDQATARVNRPFIVVVPDGHTPKEPRNFDWKDAAFMTAGFLTGTKLISTIGHAGYRAYKAWDGADSGGLKVVAVTQSEATQYTFPPSHPRENVLYVRHPVLSSVYSTTASFHRMAFEHKFAEAIDLLMSLGAVKIKVEHNRGWSREFASSISSPFHAGKAEAKITGNASKSEALLFEATFRGAQAPSLPDNLVWYPHEPTWQFVARGRLTHGLQEFALQLDYIDDFGVDADLSVAAEKAGYKLGGKFEEHRATSWAITGKFS